MVKYIFTQSTMDAIKNMTKPYNTMFMVETMIMQEEDLSLKRFLIKKYNEKMQRLKINHQYEPFIFEEI